MKKANQVIRQAASNAGVRLWQIADRMRLADGNFSRLMRKELPASKQQEILRIIEELTEEDAVKEAG